MERAAQSSLFFFFVYPADRIDNASELHEFLKERAGGSVKKLNELGQIAKFFCVKDYFEGDEGEVYGTVLSRCFLYDFSYDFPSYDFSHELKAWSDTAYSNREELETMIQRFDLATFGANEFPVQHLMTRNQGTMFSRDDGFFPIPIGWMRRSGWGGIISSWLLSQVRLFRG